VRRHAAVLVLGGVAGLGVAALVYASTPERWAARAHVRVAALEGSRPLVDPLTAALEASDPSFVAEARRRAAVAGTVEVQGVHHTQLVAVRAVAASAAAAQALREASVQLVVERQNALMEEVVAGGLRRLRDHGGAASLPALLTRPAVRIGDGGPAAVVWPRLEPMLAAGLGLGLAAGVLVAGLRRRGA
jgi:hypothetical protein